MQGKYELYNNWHVLVFKLMLLQVILIIYWADNIIVYINIKHLRSIHWQHTIQTRCKKFLEMLTRKVGNNIKKCEQETVQITELYFKLN